MGLDGPITFSLQSANCHWPGFEVLTQKSDRVLVPQQLRYICIWMAWAQGRWGRGVHKCIRANWVAFGVAAFLHSNRTAPPPPPPPPPLLLQWKYHVEISRQR